MVPRFIACVSVLCLLTLACGGRVTGPDGGTGPSTSSDDPDAGGGTMDNPSIPCPLLLPPAGLSCSYPAGTVCVYVGGGIPCHAAECDGTGHWRSTTDGC
jgi:hypothetical protein